jgi:hypothetical protein
MAEASSAQLRITTWPATVLPLPDALRFDCRLDSQEGVIVPRIRGFRNPSKSDNNDPAAWFVDTPRAARVRPNGETYLRLIKSELDLDDAEAILDFVCRYGPLGGSVAYAVLQSQGEFFRRHYAGQLHHRREWAKKQRALVRELVDYEATTPKGVPELDDDWRGRSLPSLLGHIPPYVETLDEFRFAARCLRDLYSAWRMHKERRVVSDSPWVSPSDPAEFTDGHFPSVLLSDMLRVFLSGFSPQLRLSWSYPGGAKVEDLFQPTDAVTIDPVRGPDIAPLYAICALELFNHVLDNAEYRICENDRCNKTFVYQQGRAKKGQRRRSGVRFCTPSCARATAQRRYRSRQRGRSQGS